MGKEGKRRGIKGGEQEGKAGKKRARFGAVLGGFDGFLAKGRGKGEKFDIDYI